MSLLPSRVKIRRSKLQDSFIGQTTLITQDDQGEYGVCRSDGFGSLKVKGGGESIFGIEKGVKLNTLIQSFTPYGVINDQIYNLFVASGGSVNANSVGNGIQLNISTSIGSYAVIRSKKVLKFRPGYSNDVEFDCTFDTPIAFNLQFGGIGNASCDYYFCYNGTDFAVRTSTGGVFHVVKLTINTAANSSETATVTLNGVEFEVTLSDASSDKNFTSYEVANFNYTGWNVEFVNDSLYFHFRGVGPKSGTYTFSSTGGATGTFTTTRTGVDLTSTYVNQADWNGVSSMITNLVATNRNVYAIEYSWGNTIFKVLNPDTGMYELCHTMTSTNESGGVSFLNQPNMFIQRGIASLGSSTIKSINVSGTYGGTYGKIVRNANNQPLYGTSVEKSISANTETVIMTFKNRSIINGFVNQSESYLERMSVSVNGTAPVIFKIIKNPSTLSASTSSDFTHYMFVDENNSITLCDTNSDTCTGGAIIDQFYLSSMGSTYSDFHGNEMCLNQNDVFVITAKSTSASVVDLSLTFLEDL